jgi:hypothetical protein
VKKSKRQSRIGLGTLIVKGKRRGRTWPFVKYEKQGEDGKWNVLGLCPFVG